MVVALEDLDAPLEQTTRDLLGDTITYTPAGGGPLTFKAIVDYGDNIEQLGSSGVMTSDCAVELPVSIIAEPAKGDVALLPRRPGQRFGPKDWKRDETGFNWLVPLARLPDA